MYEAQKRYYEKNKAKLLEKQKLYYQNNKEKVKSQVKEWQKKNKEKVKEAVYKWRNENRERWNENTRNYYWKNVDKLRPLIAERQRRYNAIRNPRVLSDNPTAVYSREHRKKFKEKHGISWNQIYRNGKNALKAVENSGRKCERCGKLENLQIHHKDNKGRSYLRKGLKPNNRLNNLLVLCRSCHAIHHGELARKERDKL